MSNIKKYEPLYSILCMRIYSDTKYIFAFRYNFYDLYNNINLKLFIIMMGTYLLMFE